VTSDPAAAKEIARSAALVPDWDRKRFTAMEEIVTAKFTHNQELAHNLIATIGTELVTGNSWHDQTWESCTCSEHHMSPAVTRWA
jgi:predicted NAD-dependent protein-ADP-ribosyltransferase YbiA (DUF1768 family)